MLPSRFAAKEAVIKAHPHISLSYQSISIFPASIMDGLRGARASGVNNRVDAAAKGPIALLSFFSRGGQPTEQIARVSISHDGDYATATCIGFEAETTDGKTREEDTTQDEMAQDEMAQDYTTEAETTPPKSTPAVE
jgi:phosphopantetheinyl transferase (holo-ACP synthase)